MNNSVTEKRVSRARRLLADVTPLQTDCGALCGGACCRGDEGTGMLLFPGEDTPFRVLTAGTRRLAVCPGVCDRSRRPLSCMLFPLFPAADEAGNVRLLSDARGRAVCPLARQADAVRFDRRFLRRVKAVGRFLARDEALLAFLRENAAEIRSVSALLDRF